MKYRLLKEAALDSLREDDFIDRRGLSRLGTVGEPSKYANRRLSEFKNALIMEAMDALKALLSNGMKHGAAIEAILMVFREVLSDGEIERVLNGLHESYVGEARENFWDREAGDSGWLENDWDLPKHIRRTSGKNRDAFGVEETEGLRSAFRPSERKDILGSKQHIKMLADRLISGTKNPTEMAQTIKSLELALYNLKRELQYWGKDSGVSVPDSDDVPFGNA